MSFPPVSAETTGPFYPDSPAQWEAAAQATHGRRTSTVKIQDTGPGKPPSNSLISAKASRGPDRPAEQPPAQSRQKALCLREPIMLKHPYPRIAAFLLAAATAAWSQTTPPAAAPLQFEVASIKASGPLDPAAIMSGKAHVGMSIDKARVDIGSATLMQ